MRLGVGSLVLAGALVAAYPLTTGWDETVGAVSPGQWLFCMFLLP